MTWSKVKGQSNRGQKQKSAEFFGSGPLGALRAVYVWENIFSSSFSVNFHSLILMCIYIGVMSCHSTFAV